MHINTEDRDQLQNFRTEELSAENLLSMIPTDGLAILLAIVSVGLGKSTTVDALIERANTTGLYDLVVVMAPTHNILRERKLLNKNPNNIVYKHLQRRPAELCGKSRNSKWEHFERNQMSLFAKQDICTKCPKLKKCSWQTQIGENLKDVKVIFAPQAYLNVTPNFIEHIKRSSGATKVLLILDEIDFSRVPFRKRISTTDIERHIEILKSMLPNSEDEAPTAIHETIEQLHMILNSRGKSTPIDPKKLQIHKAAALEVQKRGWETFREDFTYIGYNLEQLAFSPAKSRQFSTDGSVSFSTPPRLGDHVMVFSGTAVPGLLAHRLDREVIPVFHDYVFEHKDTRWYNLASSMGMSRYFNGNKDRILDAFSQLIVKRVNEKKKVLLICKKDQCTTCIEKLTENFKSLNAKKLSVVSAEDWIKLPAKKRKNVIPLLHYGIIGVNDFEQFDCAFCLMGYYLPNTFISDYFQEMHPESNRLPITIQTQANTPYRIVRPENYQDSIYTDYLKLGQQVLAQEEIGTVIQAVGRVRPFTHNREVILFQCGRIPGVRSIKTFTTLEEFRRYFGISNRRQVAMNNSHDIVQKLKEKGFTQEKVTHKTGLSRKTVQRHWKKAG